MNKRFINVPTMYITESVILRELSMDDLQDFYEYNLNPDMHTYTPASDVIKTIEEASSELSYWRNLFYYRRGYCWGIRDKTKNKLIGTTGFTSCNLIHNRAELGYEIAYEYWNKGLVTKIVAKLLRFADEVLKMRRVYSMVAIENVGSRRVLEKNGFEREGKLRDYAIIKNGYTDAYIYALINEKN